MFWAAIPLIVTGEKTPTTDILTDTPREAE